MQNHERSNKTTRDILNDFLLEFGVGGSLATWVANLIHAFINELFSNIMNLPTSFSHSHANFCKNMYIIGGILLIGIAFIHLFYAIHQKLKSQS